VVILKVMFTNLQESDGGDCEIYHLPVLRWPRNTAHTASKRTRQWIVAEISRSLSFLAACRDVFCHIFLAWNLFLDLYSLVQSVRFSELEWDGESELAHTELGRRVSALRSTNATLSRLWFVIYCLRGRCFLSLASALFFVHPSRPVALRRTGDCTHAPMDFRPIPALFATCES
jgi:hypothetical protein